MKKRFLSIGDSACHWSFVRVAKANESRNNNTWVPTKPSVCTLLWRQIISYFPDVLMLNLHSPPERGSHSIITVVVVVMLLELLLLLLLLLSAFYRWVSQKSVSKKFKKTWLLEILCILGTREEESGKGEKRRGKRKWMYWFQEKRKKTLKISQTQHCSY